VKYVFCDALAVKNFRGCQILVLKTMLIHQGPKQMPNSDFRRITPVLKVSCKIIHRIKVCDSKPFPAHVLWPATEFSSHAVCGTCISRMWVTRSEIRV